MISGELKIVLLIFCLYGSTCVSFVYANEGIVQRVFRGIRLRVANDRIRIVGRSPIWLNPLTPMFPAFRGCWGNVDAIAASPGLTSRVAEALRSCEVLAPYVLAVFIYTVIGIPAVLLFGSTVLVLPVVVLAYLATIILLVRLWFMRRSFSLSGTKFTLIALESMACLPFSAGIVRRLSLMTPINEDLASFLTDMPAECRKNTAEYIARRCGEMAGFYSNDSPEYMRLTYYLSRIALFAQQPKTPDLEVGTAGTPDTDCDAHINDSPGVRD